MQNISHAISTLSPVRRATAFFAFLGFLTLASCGEQKKTHLKLLDEQASVINELHDVILDTSLEAHQAAETLAGLIEQFKNLKREASELKAPSEKELAALVNHQSFSQANDKLMNLLHRLDSNAPETAQLISLIQGLHDPIPMSGEGFSQ